MPHEPAVVVGYDGSGRARAALAWAAREAAQRHLPLRLVLAVPYAGAPGDRANRSEARTPEPKDVLAEGIAATRPLLGDHRVSATCVPGQPAGALLAASEHAALLVVGQRWQDGSVSSAVGSTSLVLGARSRCPVVVVRGAGGPERAALPIVVGAKGGATCCASLDFAAAIADRREVPLVILGAWSLPPAREWRQGNGGFETAAAWARALAASSAAAVEESRAYVRQHHPAVVARTTVEHRDPTEALERASRRAGLMVLGRATSARDTASRHDPAHHHGATGVTKTGVTKGVLGVAHCPVAMVPESMVTEPMVTESMVTELGRPQPAP